MHALSMRLAVLLVVFASAAPAHVLRLGSPTSGGVVTFSPPSQRGPLPAIVDAPYSAEEVFESVLIRPDGKTWRVVDLGVTLLMKTHDPIGDHTTRLTNLKRGEPDPKLFEAPADYTVVDEAGAFVIDYSTP